MFAAETFELQYGFPASNSILQENIQRQEQKVGMKVSFLKITEKDNSFHASQAKIVKSTFKQINIIFFVSANRAQNCAMTEFTSMQADPGAGLGCSIINKALQFKLRIKPYYFQSTFYCKNQLMLKIIVM